MPPKTGSTPPGLVDLTSSDDEEAAANTMSNKISPNSRTRLHEQRGSSTAVASSSDDKSLDCRSFWKAGNFDFSHTARPVPVHGNPFVLHLMFVFIYLISGG